MHGPSVDPTLFDVELGPGLEVGCEWLCELCRPEGITPMMREFVMAPPVGQSPDHADDAADDGGEQEEEIVDGGGSDDNNDGEEKEEVDENIPEVRFGERLAQKHIEFPATTFLHNVVSFSNRAEPCVCRFVVSGLDNFKRNSLYNHHTNDNTSNISICRPIECLSLVWYQPTEHTQD